MPPPSPPNLPEVIAGPSEPRNGNDAAIGLSNDNDSRNVLHFSPEAVRPLPKASPRKSLTSKRKVRKSAVLTDTPEKNALAEEQAAKKRRTDIKKGSEKKKGKGKVKSKSKSAIKKVLQTIDGEESEDDNPEYYCIMCSKPYSKSKSGEDWIQCLDCKRWAHDRCIQSNNKNSFVCLNCNSDESSDST